MDLACDQDVCNGIDGEYKTIIHLAAFMGDEDNLLENNINSTREVVNYCKKNEARLIFTSSAAVYGNAGIYPTPEHHPISPINEYGRSKAKCEKIIEQNLSDYVILRLANVYPKDGGVIGKFQKGEHVIFGDGTNVRDYIHIDTVVDSIFSCLINPIVGTYNLGSGIGKSNNQIYKEFGTGKEPVYEVAPREEIKFSILDSKKWRRIENKYK
jgi:UDP-glucose 4-epimerase